ncbi:MAG: transcriptional repressor [Clostridiales bacterium]|nr:transcriptional repressor [Clostridiales bacterium]
MNSVQERKPFEKTKFSSQKERLYQTLSALKTHPTAEALYGILGKGKSKMSFSTIYRNLGELIKSGKVITLETIDSKIHYDADVSEHSHFICMDCGAIIDIYEEVPVPTSLLGMGAVVKDKKCIYYGQCSDCMDNKN